MTKEEQNLLDLRIKPEPEIVVVEKIVLKKRLWYVETIRTLAIVAIASAVIWGVSNADSFIPSQKVQQESIEKNFSAIGTVSDIATTTISIKKAKGSDDSEDTTYTFDTTNANVQNNHFVVMSLSDIKIGDNLLVLGTENNGTIQIRGIFSYGSQPATGILTKQEINNEVTATSTSTTTDTTLATSTASTTDATSTATSSNIIDTIKDAISSVVNVITGTTSSTTDATSTSIASTTNTTSTATTSNITSSTTSTSTIVDTVISAVQNTVQNIINTVTGGTSTPASTSDTSSVPTQTTDTPTSPPTDSTSTN